MYNPYDFQLKIDTCKGFELFNNLSVHNGAIFRACKGFKFINSGTYDTSKKECSWWYDPMRIDSHPLSHTYPRTHPIQADPRLCLKLYAPNYFSLLLINTLYDNKDILIEEQAGGMGILLFYLSKLGFKNFSLIENWSQLPKELMESLLCTENIFPHLTPPEQIPEVMNLVGYTYLIKPIEEKTELVITYNNTDLVVKGEGEDLMYRNGCLEKYTIMQNKVKLATDIYGLANAYCNKDKVEEFTKKLERYKA